MDNKDENDLKFSVRTKESKRATFIRLAEKRTTSALRKLDSIANLANKYYYEYSDEDVRKIFNALHKRLNEAEKQFLKQKEGKKEDFKL